MPEIVAVLSMQGTGTVHWQCNASSSSTDVMMHAPPQRPEFQDEFLRARRLQVCIEYQGHGLARGKDDRGALAAALIIGDLTPDSLTCSSYTEPKHTLLPTSTRYKDSRTSSSDPSSQHRHSYPYKVCTATEIPSNSVRPKRCVSLVSTSTSTST